MEDRDLDGGSIHEIIKENIELDMSLRADIPYGQGTADKDIVFDLDSGNWFL